MLYKGEQLFFLQIKANLVLLVKIHIEKITYINLGIFLIPASRTSIGQLWEYRLRLTQTFKSCRIEKNEKWAKYLLHGVSKKIKTLKRLIDIIVEMIKQVFKMSCNIKPK